MTHKVEDAIRQVEEDLGSKQDSYWERHLKKHNMQELDHIRGKYQKYLTIDVSKILNNKVWDETLAKPGGQADEIREALHHVIPNTEGEIRDYNGIAVRFFNVTQKRKIKGLRPEDEKRLIGIKCLVKRTTEVRPKIVRATFQCSNGHQHNLLPTAEDTFMPPFSCPTNGCESRTMMHIDARDIKIARQWAHIQDPLEDLTDGGQPSFLKCEILEDLCGKIMAGDRVIMNGQYRSIPIRKGGVLTTAKDVYFDTSSIEVGEREFEEVKISPEDEKLINELSKSENLFDKMTDSVAPSILGMKMLKRAIILQLFEGVTRRLKDGVINRGHINVLCVSDPGMAKTKLLRFVASIAPRGVFTNATTSTKVGLVAPIVRDETTGEYTVQAGAYMIASGGILCLDEVSELDKGDFKYLNEAMEDGEAHITKGGLNITVKTRASLLAACNPMAGSFDTHLPLAEQVKIPESTLSRFDLKVLLQDVSTDAKDRAMIEHITNNHMEEQDMSNLIMPELLRKYIAVGRKLKPKLTTDSKKVIDDYYVSIRKLCGNGENMKITLRQGTACIRLAEAHARMRLSETVDVSDAQAGVDLFDMCFRNVNTDPITGKLDMSRTDHKNGKSPISAQIMQVIREHSKDTGKAKESAIIDAMSLRGWHDADKVRAALRLMSNEGAIMSPTDGLWRAMT